MSCRAVRHGLGALYLAGSLAAGAADAAAQRGVLRALVVDTMGRPVPGVDVAILSIRRGARTDSVGRLTLSGLPQGDYDVTVRRLGYRPMLERALVTSATYDSINVMLTPQAISLDQVDVEARRHPFFLGFEQRRTQGIGTFITREQIVARNSNIPSDIFRSMPEVRLVRAGSGMGIRFQSAGFTMRNGPQLCVPMIWLDGQRAAGLEIDDIRSNDIEGIEMYRGASTTPPQFATAGVTQCGAVVVWTRRRG